MCKYLPHYQLMCTSNHAIKVMMAMRKAREGAADRRVPGFYLLALQRSQHTFGRFLETPLRQFEFSQALGGTIQHDIHYVRSRIMFARCQFSQGNAFSHCHGFIWRKINGF